MNFKNLFICLFFVNYIYSAAQSKKDIAAARAKVEAAEKALEKGEVPKTEDWQRTKDQRRFLKPSYYERVEALKEKLENAKRELRQQ